MKEWDRNKWLGKLAKEIQLHGDREGWTQAEICEEFRIVSDGWPGRNYSAMPTRNPPPLPAGRIAENGEPVRNAKRRPANINEIDSFATFRIYSSRSEGQMVKRKKSKREPAGEHGTCAKCGAADIPLVAISTKSGGKICDACNTELKQSGLPFDEFELQEDEMTVEMLMDKAGGVTRRTVQNWNKAGRIPYKMQRRRIEGVIRKQVIYKTFDVEAFLAAENEGRTSPQVHRENGGGGAEAERDFTIGLLEKLAPLLGSAKAEQPRVFGCPPLMRLSVKQAALMSGLAESHIAAAVKDADEKGLIQHYTGPRGVSVYRADQLEFVIENMPPTPKRLPPARRSKPAAGIAESSDSIERTVKTSDAAGGGTVETGDAGPGHSDLPANARANDFAGG